MDNIHTPPIRVYHENLRPIGSDTLMVDCPFCPDGVLPGARHSETYKITRNDRCTGCGQRVVYLDGQIGNEVFEEPV